MGDTALARHQSLIERQMGNIVKNMGKEKRDKLKRKLEEAKDSPNNLDSMPIVPPPKILETQENLEDPEREGSNIMFETEILIQKI